MNEPCTEDVAQYDEAQEAVQVSGTQDYAAGDDVAYSSAVSSSVV